MMAPDTVLRSLSGWEPPRPFKARFGPPFPLDSLRGPLRAFVAEVAHARQTALDLVAALALAAVTAACAKTACVAPMPDWVESLNLFFVPILPSGKRKSGVCGQVQAPLEDFERRERERLHAAIRDRATLRRSLQQRLDKAEAAGRMEEAERLAKELDEHPPLRAPRLFTGEPTPEALQRLLAEEHGRMAILSAEPEVFDILAGRYTRGQPNFGVLLSGHAGDTIRVDRVGRDSVAIPKPAITLGVAAQDDAVERLLGVPGARGRGLLARMLFVKPPPVRRRQLRPAPVSREAREGYAALVERLLQRPVSDAPPVLQLTDAGGQRLDAFRLELEERLDEDCGDLAHILSWGEKLAGAVLRLAGVLHLVEEHAGTAITEDVVERAIALGRYFLDHALVVFGGSAAELHEAKARTVLAFIERERLRTFTQREVHRALEARLPTAGDVEAALGVLQERGYLRPLPEVRAQGAGGRPSPAFEVNPYVFLADEGGPPEGGSVGSVGLGPAQKPAPAAAREDDEPDSTPAPSPAGLGGDALDEEG